MKQDWTAVWNTRTFDTSATTVLEALIRADGFEGPLRSISEDGWRSFAADVAEQLQITEGARVFEVGCGAGAFLYPFADAGCLVGGLDASAALIDIARRVMPQGEWILGDAANLDPATPSEFVVSMAAFEYFPSYDYARGVLARMAAKATVALAILDVPDLSAKEGDDAAAGLERLYFEERWFLRVLSELGLSAVQFMPQRIEGDGESASRFNVFAKV